MDLKLKDVADLLNVSEITIRRWLTDGKIPAYRINHQYRFNRAEIEDWILSQKLGRDSSSLQEDFKSESHKIPNSKGGVKQFGLYRALYKGGIVSKAVGKTKEEVIRNVMKTLAKDLEIDAEAVTNMLLERENLHPTALNNGIGLPHTRDFLLSDHYDAVAIAFLDHPIEYGALDGKPVHTLFFLFASDDKMHLHLLAKIAHLSSDAAALEFFQTHPSKEAVLDYIKKWESPLEAS